MNILITGGTGFVGRQLTAALIPENHVYILTRHPHQYINQENVTYLSYATHPRILPVLHAIVNLAGESLFGYWSEQKKRKILQSRLDTTMWLIRYMEKLRKKPHVFISGSAVGFYGMSNDVIFSEQTTIPGDDFLAHVVWRWEQYARQAENLGIRTVLMRFGLILGDGGGAWPLMKWPVKIGVGGKIAHGDQWLSWVHIEDAINSILFCILNDHIRGPVNVTSPNPRQNSDFMKQIAATWHRPYWLHVPKPIAQLGLGEMAQLVTDGQFVLPKKLETHHYPFSFPYLREALRQIKRMEQKR